MTKQRRSPNSFPQSTVRSALRHLRSADPVMCDVIRQVGPYTLVLDKNRFGTLVRSIVSQQISTKAARSIRQRLFALTTPGRLTAKKVARLDPDQLRAAGLSAQKSSYVRDLAHKTLNGEVRLRQLGRMSDEDVIAELIQVKGIGRWTAQMFLMFCLGRLDVFPHDDLGIRSALKRLYGLPDLPDKALSHKIAEPWTPYASVASWYCWRSSDGDGVA